MYAKDLSLNDAFTFVRSRKPDISPNFHFMEQLHTFERQLRNDSNRKTPSVSSSATTPSTFSDCNSYTPSSSSSLRNRFLPRENKYSCSCNITDCKCNMYLGPIIGMSPDSGIEFDLRYQNWTPSDSQTPK